MPLSFDLSIAEAHIRTADPKLAAMIDLHGPCRIDPDGLMSPFAALVRSIAYQQLTGKAAATIHGRVLTLYRPRRHPRPEDVLATADDRLRGAGLSRAKILAVKDLAAKTLDGTVPTIARLKRLDDEEIVERLSSVRGVGRWTVEMLLIFRLGRPDVLPATDYGVRKGFQRTFRTRGLPSPAQVLKRGERWRPYRSIASWYLWRSLEKPPADA
ncbi:MAG TPA: DNA-3-methyladenine glycosylase 2 family protein [Candidatus Eisenbacteria bacterium]|nr:DNA-3-methyladenine glycosylase 2 family protein [Candidatus Eisenbacteria bacterium]